MAFEFIRFDQNQGRQAVSTARHAQTNGYGALPRLACIVSFIRTVTVGPGVSPGLLSSWPKPGALVGCQE
jgi:hypothetical protein